MQIGNKLKELRKRKGLTLKDLAIATDLSLGYLSNLEHDINSPTLVNLQKICEAFEINLADFLKTEPSPSGYAIRKADFKEFFHPNPFVKYALVSDGEKGIRCVCLSIQPDCLTEETSWGHNTDELGLVLKGTLQVGIADEIFTINEQEAIYIPAHTPHKYKKISAGECISYWFTAKEVNG